MHNEQPQRAPFDQQAALEELERFGRDIERYRAQRKAVGEQFERFIQSFETPSNAAPIAASAPAAVPIARPAPPAADPIPINALDIFPDVPSPVSSTPLSRDLPPPADQPFAPAIGSDGAPHWREAVAPAAPIEPLPARPPRTGAAISTPVLVGGALIVVLAGGMLARTFWNRAPDTAPPAATTPDAPVAAPEPAPVAAPAAAPASAAAAAQPTSQSHITTLRRVWMRVTVDGQRVLEREVPGGTLVPLTAEQSIVIRTGDAGAVRLTIRGEERGVLGAEGEVVTRSFNVPARRAPGNR